MSGTRTIGRLSASLLISALAACGGGGGGDDSNSNELPSVHLTSTATTLTEGATLTITATLSSPSDTAVTVPLTVGGSASNGGFDYSLSHNAITIVAGATSASVSLNTYDDALDEGDETVILTAGIPGNATAGAITAMILSIIDNDDPPLASFALASQRIDEGATATLSVLLSAPSSMPISVPYTVGGSAGSADYAISGALTIAPGGTSAALTLSAADDTAAEADETAVVTLGTPSHASLGAIAATEMTIDDNDAAPAATGTISGRVADAATGAGLPGVAVSSGTRTTASDADGNYVLTGVVASPSTMVRFSEIGRVPQSRSTQALMAANAEATINVPMLAIAVSETYDPTTARQIIVAGSSASVQLPANALRRAGGGMPVGAVTARVTPIAPASDVELMPGNYLSSVAGGGSAPIESFGALDVSFVDADGAALDLANGVSSTLRIPVSTRASSLPATIPLYYFDSGSGLWNQEGTATLQGTAPNRYYEGAVTRLSTWNADQPYTTVTVRGCVQTADGSGVGGAIVKSEGKNYTGSASTVTDTDGSFTVAAKSNSQVFLQASKDVQISNSPQVDVLGADITLPRCLVLATAQVSIKLTWGAEPEDLDSHTLAANRDEHIFYGQPGELAANPYVALDVDDTSDFGPEITTISRLARNRRYQFYVDNYSSSYHPGQTGSPARVELIYAGRQFVFTPPAGETMQTPVWNVFQLATDANCNVTVLPLQQFLSSEPANPNPGNDASYCD